MNTYLDWRIIILNSAHGILNNSLYKSDILFKFNGLLKQEGSIYSGLMPILGYCHEPPRSTVVVHEPWRSTSKADHFGRPPRFNFPTCSLFDFRRISLFQKLVLLVVS